MTLVALALLLQTEPHLSPQKQAEWGALVDRSLREANGGDYAAALKDALAAYELNPAPALVFDLGQLQRRLGNWEQARFFFQRYLDEGPEPRKAELAKKLLAEVRAKAEAVIAGLAKAPPVPSSAVVPPAVQASAERPTRAPGWLTVLGSALLLGSAFGFYYAGFGLEGASTASGYEAQASAAQQPFYRSSASNLDTVGYVGLGAGLAAVAAGTALIAVDLTRHR